MGRPRSRKNKELETKDATKSTRRSGLVNKNDNAKGNKTNSGSEMVDGSSGSLFGAVCPGYNVETTFSLSFSFDALEEMPKTDKVLVGKHLLWYFFAERQIYNGEAFLVVFSRTNDRYKYPLEYDLEHALEAKDTKDRIMHKNTLVYDDPDFKNSGHRMITCDKLLNERDKFEVDGKITVTSKLNIRMPMCYNFNGVKSLSDVTLKIGFESFAFHKAVLAYHSNFFHAMFFGQFVEAKQDEVTLPDVDIVAFVKLINVLFIRSFELNIKSVPSVLQLADRFEMLSVLDHCEKLLVKCERLSEPSLPERLVLADKHSLGSLQKRCLELCDSAKIIKELLESPFSKDLSLEGRSLLLDRVVEVLP